MATLFEKYREQILEAFDWPEIAINARRGIEDAESRYIYLNSLSSFMPSRRTYPPELTTKHAPCSRCEGSGKRSFNRSCNLCEGLGSYEKLQDQEYWRALVFVAGYFGLWVARGEEDPYSVFAGAKIDFFRRTV